MQVFAEDPLASNLSKVVTSKPEKVLQMRLFARMKAIDPERAIITMLAWKEFVDLASRTRIKPFDTLDQYLPNRAIDAGEL